MNNEPETTRSQTNADGSSIRVLAVVLVLAIAIGALILQIKGNQPIPPHHASEVMPLMPVVKVLYREASQIKTGLNEFRGIAIHDGTLYVAGDQVIVRFDGQGMQEKFAKVAGKPRCLTLTSDGTLYAGMKDHVAVFDRNGRWTASWPSLGPRAVITSLAVSKEGIWVADAGNREVLLLDQSGKIERRIGKRDDARKIPGLVVPSPHLDVAVAADGSIVVANPGRRRVEYYTASGDLKRSWGQSSNAVEGFTGCCNPTDFALLPDGRLVTGEKSIPRVKLYAADGQFQGMVAPPGLFQPGTAGLDIAVDGDGSIYVLDPKMNAVRLFAPKNEGK